ncbi:MAG TPA: hypothetical protein VG222_07170 [Vicinamibacterales bacterium]|jgi:hypothetical protein|nr:hypothetical protein [Vicinamibacterales bacterium]
MSTTSRAIDTRVRVVVATTVLVGPDLHHRDIVTAALGSLEDEMCDARREEAVARLRRQIGHD